MTCFVLSVFTYVGLTLMIPLESTAQAPTCPPLQVPTAMMKPLFPGVQVSPVGLVVAKSTDPVSGGSVELDSTRSPDVNSIFQPRLPARFGVVHVLDEADVTYKCTSPYRPAGDRSVRWDDPDIGIVWPLPEGVVPRVAARDAAAPTLAAAECFP